MNFLSCSIKNLRRICLVVSCTLPIMHFTMDYTPVQAKPAAGASAPDILPLDILSHIDSDPALNKTSARVRRADWDDALEILTFAATPTEDSVGQPFLVTVHAIGDQFTGLKYRIPFAEASQNAALKSLTGLAMAVEPDLAELDNPDGLPMAENVSRWLGELSLESWMRPRWGAYRLERRVGSTLFIFEGVPLKTIWITLVPAADRHPVTERLLPFVPGADQADARKVYGRLERGEYRLAAMLAQPHAKNGKGWAQLVMADYANELGENLKKTSQGWLDRSAETFVPTRYVLGIPDSTSADTYLADAATEGFPPAVSLLAAKNLLSAPARPTRDSKLVQCDEAAAAMGDRIAMLRAIWRVTEGGFRDNEEAYLRLKIAQAQFGESISHTVARYIMQPLGHLHDILPARKRAQLDRDAQKWSARSFEQIRQKLVQHRCLD